MDERVRAEALLRGYGEVTGLGALAFDEDDHCRLEFDQRVLLDLALDVPGAAIVLMSPLGEVRAEERPDLLVEMLDANALWHGTDGATLGLDRRNGLAVLAQALPLAGLEVGAFEARVDGFVATASAWLDRVAGVDGEAASATETERPDPMQMRV